MGMSTPGRPHSDPHSGRGAAPLPPGRLSDRLAAYRLGVAAPVASLRRRLSRRIAEETGEAAWPPPTGWTEPDWIQVAPGTDCKLLASDEERGRVSMLVRLAPGASYPPHRHAGTEDLYLLDGELWIEERLLLPGDCSHAEAGSSDRRVWSETGCTCLLVTSTGDELR
jgi:anti-sigma factor ChrR (cupin superfamily)